MVGHLGSSDSSHQFGDKLAVSYEWHTQTVKESVQQLYQQPSQWNEMDTSQV